VHWSVNDVSGSGGDSPQGQTYVKINGGMIPSLYEYKVESGGIEPLYVSTKGSKVTVDNHGYQVSDKNGNPGHKEYTVSTRSAGVGEVMVYKIGKKRIPQARGHGASRKFTSGSRPLPEEKVKKEEPQEDTELIFQADSQ
jgi:hypothetical protein